MTQVTPSPVFKRKGDNLEVEVPLTIPEALRGAEVQVPTLDGTKTLRVPPGTPTAPSSDCAARARPSSQRVPPRGDIHYRFVIDIPKDPQREQQEAVETLSQTSMNGNPREPLFDGAGPGADGRRSAEDPMAMADQADRDPAPHPGRDQSRRVHDLGRGGAGQHAPADAAHVRGRGLIEPKRSPKGTRLYSQEDVDSSGASRR